MAQYIVRWVIGILISSILIISGSVMLIFKPKANIHFLGEVGRITRKNGTHWRYSANIMSAIMLVLGEVLLLETILLNTLRVDIKIFMPVFAATLITGLILMVFLPEFCLMRHIKKIEKNNEEIK